MKRKLLELNIEGSGKAHVKSGIGFLNHKLDLLAFQGLFDQKLNCKGDLKVVEKLLYAHIELSQVHVE